MARFAGPYAGFAPSGKRLQWLGTSVDPEANAAHALRISRPDSGVAVLVVPTDEELMIVRHTVAVLAEHDIALDENTRS